MRPGAAFLGSPRVDGRVGVRNHVLVVPTVICAAVVAERIAAAIAPIGAALPHLAGCGLRKRHALFRLKISARRDADARRKTPASPHL